MPYLNEQYKIFCKIANKTNFKINSINVIENSIPESLKRNDFCSDKIYKYILKNCTIKYTIQFNNNNYLNYYTDSNFFNLNQDNIEQLHHICFIIALMKNITKNKHELIVNFYNTPFEKKFPNKKGIILDEDNCNSGSSLIGKYNISIWRKEEYKRVLIHECFHALECDNILLYYPEFDNKISDYFCVKENINFCETYTETWATIINLFYYGWINKIDNIHSYYLKELNYSIKLAKSILNHYNYKSIDEIFLSNTCKYFPQKTSVFNYYICKPFFLYHINDFLKNFNFKNIKLNSVKDCNKLFKLLIKYFSNIEIRFKIDESKGNSRSLKMVFY